MKFVPKAITRSIGKKVLTTKANSPHIYFAVGMVGVVGGAVLACRATLKLEKNLDQIKDDLKAVTDTKEERQLTLHYTEQDYRKDLGYVYLKSGVRVAKLYGPSIVIGGLGIAALTGSHVQLTRRNQALSITLAGVMQAYEAYRQRIQEELGEERELEIYRDVQKKVVDVDGKKKSIQSIGDPNRFSLYAKCFDESNLNWQRSAEMNRVFIQLQQNYANEKLRAQGYLFLNDVYDMLGFDRTTAGQVVGWLSKSKGDGYIDFNMFDGYNAPFINGQERSIWLDFNDDGSMYDQIEDL